MSDTASSQHDVFATTHWSVVQLAGRQDTPRAQRALSTLCAAYWYPLYAYVRRHGHSPHDAQDLTQGFFAALLESNSLANLNPSRGRFRAWLLASLKHFLANEWDRARAAKRGGGQITISLDETDAEERYKLEPFDELSADKIFERRWALTLLDTVVNTLREEYQRDGKGPLFDKLKPCLAGSRESQPYADLAPELGMTEGAVKVAVHRFRQRYRELLRREIAHTVSSPAEVDEELRYLFAVLAG
ncbi:MAG TPA: sigma-70 family RNA polymerase sigma factor [Candidatus Acidoferrum sp.]|nr:sigma-70 family RNA polymerase sigma factor [Candidatus Acidoferrum sp.]